MMLMLLVGPISGNLKVMVNFEIRKELFAILRRKIAGPRGK